MRADLESALRDESDGTIFARVSWVVSGHPSGRGRNQAWIASLHVDGEKGVEGG